MAEAGNFRYYPGRAHEKAGLRSYRSGKSLRRMGVSGGCGVTVESGLGRRLADAWDDVLHRVDLPRARACGSEGRVQKPIRSTGRYADGVQPWEPDRPDDLPDVLLPRPGSAADWCGDFRAPRAHENYCSHGSNDCGTESARTGNSVFVRTSFSPSSKPHSDRVGPIKQFRYRDERAIRARDGYLPQTIWGRISCFTEFPFLLHCRC
jgi:hypothetical protein